MSKPDPPTPPDPVAVANAQASANQQTALEQQKLNMVNSYGPQGSSVYSADPTAPGGYAQTTTLSPGQQSLYNSDLQAQQGAAGLANNLLTNISGTVANQPSAPTLQTNLGNTDFTQATTDARNTAYDQARTRLDPQWQQGQSQIETQLANQGLTPGGDAYNRAYQNFSNSKNDAYNQAWLSSYGAGLGAQNQGYNQAASTMGLNNAAQQSNFQNQEYTANQPVNTFNSLMSGTQVQAPQGINYTPSQVAPTDVTGAYALSTQAQNANYQQQMANQQSGLGGLFNLGSAAITGYNPLGRLALGKGILGF